jgi:hypothetical protein
LRDEAGSFVGLPDARGEIDQAGDDAGLVAYLMQMAEPASDCGLWNLADQGQHRRIHSMGGQQRRRGVEQTRARHHTVGLRLAGRERGAERHVRRTLLMARVDGANAVARLEQRIKQGIVVHPRQRINRVDAVRDERGDGKLRRAHPAGLRRRSLGLLFRGHGVRASIGAARLVRQDLCGKTCADRTEPVEGGAGVGAGCRILDNFALACASPRGSR